MRCGHGQAHAPGRPCRLDRCPQCGAALLREGSHHHQKALARLAAQAKPEG
ncbi:MAG: ferredoxin [Myxococcales bacterium]|nr:ferredoxin [Myxococcales bacterium]